MWSKPEDTLKIEWQHWLQVTPGPPMDSDHCYVLGKTDKTMQQSCPPFLPLCLFLCESVDLPPHLFPCQRHKQGTGSSKVSESYIKSLASMNLWSPYGEQRNHFPKHVNLCHMRFERVFGCEFILQAVRTRYSSVQFHCGSVLCFHYDLCPCSISNFDLNFAPRSTHKHVYSSLPLLSFCLPFPLFIFALPLSLATPLYSCFLE